MSKRIEDKLTKIFDCSRALAAGRANVLLYSIFKTLPKNSEIVFPAIMCPSPLIVAEMTGHEAILCDVNQNGIISFESIKKLVSLPNRISAIVAVNLYGQASCSPDLYNFCRANGILLIEDAALGWDPNQVLKYSDVAVFSFGSKKTFDAGGGGCALTNHQNLFNSIKCHFDEIVYPEKTMQAELSKAYQNLYYGLQTIENLHSGSFKNFSLFTKYFYDLYMVELDSRIESNIYSSLNSSDEIIESRIQFAKVYLAHLAKMNSKYFKSLYTSEDKYIPWRFSLLYSGPEKDSLIKILRSNDIDVSCWYPSLEILGFKFKDCSTNNALNFGSNIINFWLDSVTEDKIAFTFQLIRQFLESESV